MKLWLLDSLFGFCGKVSHIIVQIVLELVMEHELLLSGAQLLSCSSPSAFDY